MSESHYEALAKDVLDQMGIRGAPDQEAQLGTMLEALAIYNERDKQRQGLWKRYGWRDSLMHMRSKMGRLEMLLDVKVDGGAMDMQDEALDLINYTVFFLRNARAGRESQQVTR